MMGFKIFSILLSTNALLLIISSKGVTEASDAEVTDSFDPSDQTPLSHIAEQLPAIDRTDFNNTSITTTYPRINERKTTIESILEGSDDEYKKKITKKPIGDKGVKVFRWSRERDYRFPIRRPKLTKVNQTEYVQKSRIGYASALHIRQTDVNTTLTPIRKTYRRVKSERRKRKRLPNNNQTSTDIFEISSSDHSPSIAFFVSKRTPKRDKHSGHQVIIGTLKAVNGTKELKRIPKLLLPKALRPAMYSLDGFVPRPSLNKITSTEAPTTEKPQRFASRRIKNKKLKTQLSGNKSKRFGGNRIESHDDEKVDEIDVSDSRRRNIVAKRKGLLTSDSIQKPTVNSNRIANSKRRGTPGKDYPTLNSVPKTTFECSELDNGVYADMETGCQVWHMCQNRFKHSFLCPNGTIFNEKNGICDWWYNYDCPTLVKLNDKIDQQLNGKKDNERSKRSKLRRA